jgi:hypothetical protein
MRILLGMVMKGEKKNFAGIKIGRCRGRNPGGGPSLPRPCRSHP